MAVDQKWLRYAQEDLRVAEISFKEGVYNQVCFHSQQAVEKVLKGFLEENGTRVPKTHSLVDLIDSCIDIDINIVNFQDYADTLDGYYIPTRYPDALPGMMADGLPDREDAKEALNIAKEIVAYLE